MLWLLHLPLWNPLGWLPAIPGVALARYCFIRGDGG
jgi:hypothetical protein